MAHEFPMVMVDIFCTHCGNRTMIDAQTRDRITLLVKILLRDYLQLCEDVAAMRCVDCGGPMDLKIVAAE